MCNPPFYHSQEEATQANARKLEGLCNEAKARDFSRKQQ